MNMLKIPFYGPFWHVKVHKGQIKWLNVFSVLGSCVESPQGRSCQSAGPLWPQFDLSLTSQLLRFNEKILQCFMESSVLHAARPLVPPSGPEVHQTNLWPAFNSQENLFPLFNFPSDATYRPDWPAPGDQHLAPGDRRPATPTWTAERNFTAETRFLLFP